MSLVDTLALLPARVADIVVRQLRHLLPGDAEMDAAGIPGYAAGGDSHVLVTPQGAFLEKYMHVGHLVRAWIDAERAELPDLTVGGVDMVAAVFLLLGRQQDRNEVYFSPEHRAGR